MIIRRLFLPAAFAVAAVGPYVGSETQLGRQAMTSMTNLFRSSNDQRLVSSWETGPSTVGGADTSYANHSHYENEKLRLQKDTKRYRYDHQLARKLGGLPADPKAQPRLVGANVKDLREVMRFDINPDWVLQRFSRVTTVLGNVSLRGLRVPIVTGIRADDVAGTLTYYFDGAGALQRISLHGFTGDAHRLVLTMTEHYQMQQERTLEAGVYTRRWNGKPVHFLRLTHAPVVHSNAVHQKYTVFMELNQPSLIYGISNEAMKIVHSDLSTNRW